MPEDDSADSNAQETDKEDERPSVTNTRPDRFPVGLRVILFSGIAALVLLLLVSIFHPYMTERVKFFAVNALSVLVLAAIAIQVYINRRQWDAMQESLDETRKMSAHNERMAEAMHGQLEVMKDQAEVMRETLAETRRIFDLTERPIVVVENATILDLSPNRPISAMITLVNKGRSAAKNISVFFRIAKPGYVYIMYPQSNEYPVEIPFLAAGDKERIIDAPVNAITINDKMFHSIIEGHEGLMIYGRGSYEDMAGRKYILDEYAFRYDSKQRGFSADYYSPTLWSKNKAMEQAAAREEENPS